MDSYEKQKEDGIFIGNQVDKSELRNPISRKLVQGFDQALLEGLDEWKPQAVHEVGCGEGRLTRMISKRYGIDILGTDFSKTIIEANLNSTASESIQYVNKSIYELDPETDPRDVIVCCEVLEHLEDPVRGLEALKSLNGRGYILSVPREPVWKVLNMVRGKYWRDWGNTPGHLNRWSFNSFSEFLNRCGFAIKVAYNPFPWIMVSAMLKEDQRAGLA